MRQVLLLVVSVFVVMGCARSADEPPLDERSVPTSDALDESAIEARLFSAELVMNHQASIGLDDAQSTAIRSELASAQAELVEAEWSLRREREALATTLEGARVDEARAMAAADRVIAAEDEIKRVHLRLLLRIKNLLTPAQQERLGSLRAP